MYTVSSLRVLGLTAGSAWVDIPPAGVAMSYLYNNYIKVYATVTSVFNTTPVYLDVDQFRSRYAGSSYTLQNVLDLLGNASLVTETTMPSGKFGQVRYVDARQAGYKIDLAKVGVPVGNAMARNDKTDVFLTATGRTVSYTTLDANALVTVNGFIHTTVAAPAGLYVVDANKSLTVSGKNMLGMLDFSALGGIQKYAIKATDIIKDGTTALVDKCFIKVPGNTTGKSVFLVIGGYLYLPEPNVCYQSGANMMALCLSNTQILNRLFDSARYIDLKPMGITSTLESPAGIDLGVVTSDTNIVKYLTMSQSMVVVVNKPALVVSKSPLRTTSVPGEYFTTIQPTAPLVTNYGRLMEYWRSEQDGVWCLRVVDGRTNTYIASLNKPKTSGIVTPNTLPTNNAPPAVASYLYLMG